MSCMDFPEKKETKNLPYLFDPQGQLLPTVFTHNAWGILHTLLEMFSYRLHHTQLHYRIQLLSHLHHPSQSPQTNQNQLQL
uniref:Mediator of RNA polymerase II transcription subunit 23 n=1 Tax=Magallana gigas TaxID=29159 RepID=A0A8W8IM94_MAGGI